MAKFAYLIDVYEATLNRTELAVAKARVGCENIESTPRELLIVAGNQRRKLTISVINRIDILSGLCHAVNIMHGRSEPAAAGGSPIDKGKALALDEGPPRL